MLNKFITPLAVGRNSWLRMFLSFFDFCSNREGVNELLKKKGLRKNILLLPLSRYKGCSDAERYEKIQQIKSPVKSAKHHQWWQALDKAFFFSVLGDQEEENG